MSDNLQHKWSNRIARRFINKVDDLIELIREAPKIFPVINQVVQVVVTKTRNRNIKQSRNQ